jgi:hypothetical protein
MKGLSVLFTVALFVTAHLLAGQLRRARALPAQHHSPGHVAQTASSNRAAHTPAPANHHS